MARNFYIATAGTMGSGKTTVARLISQKLNCHLLLENFEENRFLPRFYKNMARWAFHSQTFFLLEKISQMFETKELLKKTAVIQDTVIFQDVFSYAKAQFVLGNMDQAEFSLYTKIYASFVDQLPQPDLIVYLKAPVRTLQQRIKRREKSVNKNPSLSYLKTLDQLNRQWVEKQARGRVLFFDAQKNNFALDQKQRQQLIDKIKDKLKNKK